MTGVRVIRAAPSPAFIPEEHRLRRLPRQTRKPRPEGFFERFEDRALVYDCFWHADGERILLVGPPPMNLRPLYRTAAYEAHPSGERLTPRYYTSLSTMITELAGVPRGTAEIVMRLDDMEFPLRVRANMSSAFTGRRLLFTMSKDNELGWIDEWARWHVAFQGADAIVVFDNGSSRYGIDEIEKVLTGVPGIATAAVLSWPWRYGMTDTAFLVNPFYVLFLQVSSMGVLLRRFGATAYGILNCDVDELVSSPEGSTVFDLAHASRHGLVVMRGRYVEAVPADGAPEGERRHRHYVSSFADPKRAASRPKKWALDPNRPWVRNLAVHPYMHWIEGRPPFGKSTPPGTFYRHFRGINTNWKDRRTDTTGISRGELTVDAEFARIVAQSEP